jgi:hypothetical protein
MTDDLTFDKPMIRLGMFWWAFAARGGAAVLFSAFLFYAGGFFGTIFFDPISNPRIAQIHLLRHARQS